MDREHPEPKHCRIVHQTRRRIRILAPGLRRDTERAYVFEILLRKHRAIQHVRMTPEIGSFAVYFDPAALPKPKLIGLLDTLLANLGKRDHVATELQASNEIDGAPEREFNVALEGMTCVSCALLVELILRRDPLVADAKVNFATETAQIRARLSKEQLYAKIRGLGYTAYPLDSLSQRRLQLHRERERIGNARSHCLWASVLSAPAIVLGMMAPHSRFLGLVQLAFTAPVVLWSGRPFFDKAAKLAKKGSANMDSLVALGVGSAFGYSLVSLLRGRGNYYFEAAAGIVSFVLMGRYLDEKARGEAHEAIRQLIDLQPQQATVIQEGREVVVLTDDVQLGDVMLVRPGERIPTDGIVVHGLSTVDESMVTGESMPIVKQGGDPVTGGCINGNGALQIRATAVGPDTVLAGIIHMVDQAQASRLPIQKLVDRVSSVFVPAVIGVSALTFVGWLGVGAPVGLAFGNAITVLLIACPCALGLATPAAIMVGTGQAARRGIFIRNGESLEMASKLTVVIFDKTGTITEGRPQLTDLVNISDLSDTDLLQLTAAAESHSEHFLAQAIVNHVRALGLPLTEPSGFQSEPGHGIRATIAGRDIRVGNRRWLEQETIACDALDDHAVRLGSQGKTPVFVALDGRASALVGIADKPRANAKAAIARLNGLGVRTLMATGDVATAAEHVAGIVGIDEVIAHARPEHKLEIVRELQASGEKVGMIGDGINDAPALAAADVSLAIGGGTDVAMQTADLTLVNGDIAKAADAMELSTFTLRVIRQNLFWAFGYNAIAVPVAAFGRLNPMIASAAMALSSVSVVMNSLRLQRD